MDAFGSISSGKSSMRRKQSNSILGTFTRSSSSRASAIPFNPSNPNPTPGPSSQSQSTSQPPPSAYSHSSYPTPPTSSSSHFPDQSSLDFSPEYYNDSASSRAPSMIMQPGQGHGHTASRSISGSASGTSGIPGTGSAGGSGGTEKRVMIRRPEDVYKITRERLFSWSYMMQWYQGDIHWFNTVKISRSLLEQSLGPAKVDSRARNVYLLGMSLSPLMDITNAGDFVRALLKLLDDWEAGIAEGGKGVKTLFNKKSQKKASVLPPELSANITDPDSHLLNFNPPFPLDFFQTHASFCSIIRDIYKKFLQMVLPVDPALGHNTRFSYPQASTDPGDVNQLIHPSTIIASAPIDGTSSSGPMSPMSTFSSSETHGGHPSGQVSGNVVSPTNDPIELKKPIHRRISGGVQAGQGGGGGGGGGGGQGGAGGGGGGGYGDHSDAFQALVAGQLPTDRMLVGDGQALTPGLVENFVKVDARLKKHFSTLIREGDALAKRVLEDEFNKLATSLHTGAPIAFDYQAALSVNGNGNGNGNGGGMTGTGSVFREVDSGLRD